MEGWGLYEGSVNWGQPNLEEDSYMTDYMTAGESHDWSHDSW